MGVKKCMRIVVMLTTIFFIAWLSSENVFAKSNGVEKYKKDYLSRVYDSEDGLEGTTANCICSDENGFLWIGGYTGLYRYDGTELKKYLLGGRAIPVNDIVVDHNGNLWIGTNGSGLYFFDGKDSTEFELDDTNRGSGVINRLYYDKDGIIWAGTKAGLFSIDISQDEKAVKEYKRFSNELIRDIGELESGQKIIILKGGETFLLDGDDALQISLDEDVSSRCCYGTKDGDFYIGTTGNILLKLSENGEILSEIDGGELSSFNQIYEVSDGEYWVCSDTGIGVLKDDEIYNVKAELNESIEQGCQDFQGNFWFVSSGQGILQLYQNYFSDLGSYWDIKQSINSIQPYNGKIYVGCNDGLYCFEGENRVTDELTESCKDFRIRQIYEDNNGNLWIATHQHGIWKMDADGNVTSYTLENSGFATDKARCISQKADGQMMIGTEEGLYLMDTDGGVYRTTLNATLNSTRILDAKEDREGRIYVATDGYGIYEICDNQIRNIYSKRQGLLSDVVMKVVPSDSINGVWAVTGEGICFIDEDGNISSAAGIPVANCLDLILCDDGNVVVLAGNGLFVIKEKDLLKDNASYIQYSKSDGLPVDFTANARNIIYDNTLYMCGTTGAVSMDIGFEQEKKPVRLYIESIMEDGKAIDSDSDIVFSADTHRININIQMINFVHRNVYATYFLKGTDTKKTFVNEEDLSEISYTNLKGGSYTYQYKLYDADTDECLAVMSVSFAKDYKYLEQFRVRVLIILLAVCGMIFLMTFMTNMHEKQMKRRYYMEFLEEKEQAMAELAYKDLVTGVYNRNYFEQEKYNIDLSKMYALVSVSINYVDFFKGRYGVFETDKILRTGVEVIRQCSDEDLKICRVSDNIFYFWFMQPVKLEKYIYDIKEKFSNKGEKRDIPYSFSVGAIYNNTVGKEKIEELIDRCDKMRLLDEKHAATKFIESRVNVL